VLSRTPNIEQLAFALERVDRVADALAVCQDAIKLARGIKPKPKMCGMLLAEARCYSKLNRKHTAIERLNEALEESPSYRSGLQLKAIIAQEIKDHKSELEALYVSLLAVSCVCACV
jgi:hypothetical protein